MSFVFQEWIERASEEAEHILGTSEDLTQVANAYAEEAAGELSNEVAGDEKLRPLLRQTKTLTVVAGVATLSDDTLIEYLDEADVYDSAGLTKQYSYCRERIDFRAPKSTLIGYWQVEGKTYNQLEPTESFSATLGFTGSMRMVVPCWITLPTLATAAITIPSDLEDVLVAKLVKKIVGVVKKAA